MSNRLREIEALGQAVWIDNLNRQLLDDGTLAELIEEDGISGVTSNPTIFEKGMGSSDRYDDAFREVLRETSDPQEVFERLGPWTTCATRPTCCARRSRRPRDRTATCRSSCRPRSRSTPRARSTRRCACAS